MKVMQTNVSLVQFATFARSDAIIKAELHSQFNSLVREDKNQQRFDVHFNLYTCPTA